MVDNIANPHVPTVGEEYHGTVVKTAAFGAFITLYPGKDGLLHISQLKHLAQGKRVEKTEDVLNVGDKVHVKINEIDQRGKLSLVPVNAEENA
jgi:polyribonucleotide nucleotidyltransferase